VRDGSIRWLRSGRIDPSLASRWAPPAHDWRLARLEPAGPVHLRDEIQRLRQRSGDRHLEELCRSRQQAIGNLFAADGRWRDADNAFRRAIEVDPSLTFIHTEFVLSSLLPQGRLDRALAVLAAAEERDPLSRDVRRVKALVEVGGRS
jgi:tetratricopeptide (TPR) repeat protein